MKKLSKRSEDLIMEFGRDNQVLACCEERGTAKQHAKAKVELHLSKAKLERRVQYLENSLAKYRALYRDLKPPVACN